MMTKVWIAALALLAAGPLAAQETRLAEEGKTAPAATIAEAHGQGDFVVLGIFFTVPQVVEVEDGGGQESGTQGRSPVGR